MNDDLFSFRNDDVVKPYAGTSGWSGTDTSRARATRNDSDGTTSRTQALTLALLGEAGINGLTWKELSELTGLHHGSASGALSVLHKSGKIARLTQVRKRCKVYVLPSKIDGRDVESQKQKTCRHCGGEL